MDNNMPSQIFKAYDIRGLYPQELSQAEATQIAQAYLVFLC